MAYAPVNGLQLYYETYGSGRPLVLLHGGLLTIDLNFGPLLEPLAAGRQVIAVELQGHGHTADTGRAMTIEALAGDVVALLDQLGIAEADLFGFSLGGRSPPAGQGERAARRGPPADGGRLPGVARRLRGDRSRSRALRGVRGQDLGDGARVRGVDRRAAITADADPADLRRPRLLTVASRGGAVRAPAGRATGSAPRDHARRRDTAAQRSARADHAVPRRALSGGHAPAARSWTAQTRGSEY